jgi:ubiquinone/menaquinone biosynthesis C-methylase UbiE
MALKNGARGRWIVGLLDIGPADRVLEVGFGPGADLARLPSMGEAVSVAGIDASPTMVARPAAVVCVRGRQT